MRAARPKQPCALAGVGRRGRHSHCSSRSAARPLAAGVGALQLQEAPGEQAALDGPEQGQQHGASLPLGTCEHQQFTLREADRGRFHGGGRAQDMGTGTRSRQPSPAQSCPRFKCDREKRQVKATLSPSRSPEASRMVFTISSLPFCPLRVSSYQQPPLSYA